MTDKDWRNDARRCLSSAPALLPHAGASGLLPGLLGRCVPAQIGVKLSINGGSERGRATAREDAVGALPKLN